MLGLFRTSTVITTITVTVAPTDLTIPVTVTLVQKSRASCDKKSSPASPG